MKKPRPQEKTPAAQTAGVPSAQNNPLTERTELMNSNAQPHNTLSLVIGEITILQDEEGRYSLNDLHAASGGAQKHGPKYWMQTLQSKDLIEKLEAELIDGKGVLIGGIPPIKTVAGRYGGTMKKLLITVAAAVALAGCATRGADFSPIVDSKDRDAAAIATNTYECQEYARTQAGAGGGAVVGAIVGALFMAALAPHGNRNDWARSGAIVGGAGGAVGANDSQEAIIRKCLQGRGFSVLN